MNYFSRLLAFATLLAMMIPGAFSQASIIHEPFGQAAGPLNGAAGGTGLGTWNSPSGASVGSQTFSYGLLPNSGNQVTGANVSGDGDRANVTTTSALLDAGLLNDGATLWFSVMTTGASGSNHHSGFGFGTAPVAGAFNGLNMPGGNGVGFYTRQGNVQAIGWTGGTRSTLGGTLAASQANSNLIVGRVQWGATGTDPETVTIYNVDENTMVLPGSSSSTSVGAFNQANLNVISFASRSGLQNWDEIRFGASFEDVITDTVIPEPTSLALLGFGGLLARMFRRRAG